MQKLLKSTAAGWRARQIEDEASMAAAFARAGLRIVAKKGISVDGVNFSARELGAVSGKEVEYRLHADRGKLIIFSTDVPPQFICVAVNLNELEETEQQSRALDAGKDYR